MKTIIVTNVGSIRFEFQLVADRLRKIYVARAFQGNNCVDYKAEFDREKAFTNYWNMVKTEYLMCSNMPEAELQAELAKMKAA